jgi:hypothetical protein
MMKMALTASISEDKLAKQRLNHENPNFGTQYENMTEEEQLALVLKRSVSEEQDREAAIQ